MSQSTKLLFPALMLACFALPANAQRPSNPQKPDDQYATLPQSSEPKPIDVQDVTDDPQPGRQWDYQDITAASPGRQWDYADITPASPGRDQEPVSVPPSDGAQVPALKMLMAFGRSVFHIEVHGSTDFVALVLLSPTPGMSHFLVDLPPMLTDGQSIGIFKSAGGLLQIDLPYQGPAIDVWGQTLVLADDQLVSSDIAFAGPAPSHEPATLDADKR